MKEDYRAYAAKLSTPLWTIQGAPLIETDGQLTVWWLEGRLKIIFCQKCWKPFLTFRPFKGEPPFHNQQGNKVCAGNDMPHLDPYNRPDHLDLIDDRHVSKKANELIEGFWSTNAERMWRIDHYAWRHHYGDG